MAFVLKFFPSADATLTNLENDPNSAKKLKKVRKCLALIESDPRHPSLNSYPYESRSAPKDTKLWHSYVENNTPSAWRVFWIYGPGRGEITVVAITPHGD